MAAADGHQPGEGGSAQRVPTLITFDLDGILLDDSVWQPTIIRTCERLGREIGYDATRLHAANAEVWAEYWPAVEHLWPVGGRDGASITVEAWARTLERAGYDMTRAEEVAKVYLDERAASLRLFPDADEALSTLRQHVALVVITNGASDTQRAALRTLGVVDRFSAVIISSEVGMAKPDPAIYRAAIASVGAEPASAWHVGDGLETDVAGARAAGMVAVWMNRTGHPRAADSPQPDLETSSLTELAELVTSSTQT